MRRWSKALDALGRHAGKLRGRGWPVLYWDAGAVRAVSDAPRAGSPRRRDLHADPPQWQLDQLGSLRRKRV